jgi:hypothetical protein
MRGFITFASPNIIRVFKSKRMIWAVYVLCMGEMRNTYIILVGNVNGGDHFEDPGLDGRMIFKLISWKECGRFWAGFIWLRVGTSGGFL